METDSPYLRVPWLWCKTIRPSRHKEGDDHQGGAVKDERRDKRARAPVREIFEQQLERGERQHRIGEPREAGERGEAPARREQHRGRGEEGTPNGSRPAWVSVGSAKTR